MKLSFSIALASAIAALAAPAPLPAPVRNFSSDQSQHHKSTYTSDILTTQL